MADKTKKLRVPLREATMMRKRELDKARLATRVTLNEQKERWDRVKAVLKMKDYKVAKVLLDTSVNLFSVMVMGLLCYIMSHVLILS